MTFARVKPDSWAVNEELSSAQINQLDVDHTLAIDKTGDNFTGDIVADSGARMLFSSGSFCNILDGGILEVQPSGLLRVSGAGFLTLQSGSIFTCSGTAAFAAATITLNAGSTFTAACSIIANAGVNATLGFFSDDVTCYKSLIMDGDSVAGNNKLRIKDAAYLDVENFSRARFLSGSKCEMLSGSTTEYNGTITHKTGSIVTYDSGSQLLQDGTWTLRNETTVTPTGTFFCSSGATVTFVATPLFQGGFTASTSGTVAISVPATLSGAMTTISSSSIIISGSTLFSGYVNTTQPVGLGGTTTILGASNRLMLSPRNVERRICLARAFKAAFTYSLSSDSVTIGTGGQLAVDLDPPNGSVLSDVVVTWTGTGNVTINVMANAVVLATLTTSTPGTHTLTANASVARDTTTYRLTFEENASNIPTVTVVKTNCAVSEYDEG